MKPLARVLRHHVEFSAITAPGRALTDRLGSAAPCWCVPSNGESSQLDDDDFTGTCLYVTLCLGVLHIGEVRRVPRQGTIRHLTRTLHLRVWWFVGARAAYAGNTSAETRIGIKCFLTFSLALLPLPCSVHRACTQLNPTKAASYWHHHLQSSARLRISSDASSHC